MATRKLSTIELTVLGMAWREGPCTIYTIMKELGTAESTYHRSRAGTAYSVAKRLIGFGYLVQAEGSEENLVSISELGKKALQDWIAPPIPIADVAHTADLIRLRFYFLTALTLDQRLAFIDHSLEGLQVFLNRLESLMSENQKLGDYFGALAMVGSIMETRARIQWLRLIRDLVKNPLPEDQDWADQLMKKLPDWK